MNKNNYNTFRFLSRSVFRFLRFFHRPVSLSFDLCLSVCLPPLSISFLSRHTLSCLRAPQPARQKWFHDTKCEVKLCLFVASSDTGSKALLRGCRFAQDCVLSVPWKVYCSGDWRDERDILVTLQVIRLEHSATRHTYKAKYCVFG